MKTRIVNLLVFICFLSFTACSSDDDQVEAIKEPALSNVEIGSGNNGQGIIGRDFHLNADIVAGELIDMVRVDILPREGEEYAEDWSFTIEWDEFKGSRNTTVHKHFDIPADAPEGVFDFIITVTDQNGSSLEEIRDITIYAPENLPVDPQLYAMYAYKNEVYIEFPTEVQFTKTDTLKSQAFISGVKGDGKMYLLLINKKYYQCSPDGDNTFY